MSMTAGGRKDATSPSNASMLLTGHVVTADRIIDDGALIVDGDQIVWVGPRAGLPQTGAGTPQDWQTGRTLLPGLVDVHCHGGGGGEFGTDAEASRTAAAHHLSHGTTTLIASLVSASPEVLLAGTRALASLLDDGVLAGIHLEGPFLSTARCGAQDPTTLTDPDPALTDAIATEARGGFAQMTLAPERPGAGLLVAQLATHGALPAIGHTDADATTARRAFEQAVEHLPRGLRPLVTHVFNGMPPLHHRSPGPAAAALSAAGRGEAVLEVIADGVHLAAETVRMLFETIGPGSIALITDAMAASGMPDGRYTLGGREVDVADQTVRLTDGGAIAGGVATLIDTVRFCVREAQVPLIDAVQAASRTPAHALAQTNVGELTPGQTANIVVVDEGLQPVQVLNAGVWVA